MNEKPSSKGIEPVKREGRAGAPRPKGPSRLRKEREVKKLWGSVVRYGDAGSLGRHSPLPQGTYGSVQQMDVPLGKFQVGIGGELACCRPHGIDRAGIEKRGCVKEQKALSSVSARQLKQACDTAISAVSGKDPNGGITDVREEGAGRVQMRPADLEKFVISVERAGEGPR